MTLRAAISFVDPKVSVAYTRPVTEVAYVLMTAVVYEDTSGRFQFVPDIVVVADAAALATNKAVSDPVGVVDSQVLEVSKGLADTVGMVDVILPQLVYLRDFADTLAASDASTFLASKFVAESLVAIDQVLLDSQKAFADGIGLNEQFAFEFSLANTIDNVAFVSDLYAVSTEKQQTEAVMLGDGGSVTMQDYCDITYFAADYVGVAVTF